MSEIEFEVFSLEQLPSLSNLLVSSPSIPYRYLINKDIERYIQYWSESIRQSVQSQTCNSLVAMQGGQTVGFLMMDELLWDSKIFNMRMCKIAELVYSKKTNSESEISHAIVSRAIQWAKEHQYDFILCKSCTDDMVKIHALENTGFVLVDTLLDYHVDFRRVPWEKIPIQTPENGVTIRLVKPDDELELVELAHSAFNHHFGRYHSDPRISSNQATQVYEEWVRSSLTGYSDYFILAEINHRIVGLSAWKNPSELERQLPVKIGHHSIGAVHPDFYGRKLFTLLTYEGMKLLKDGIDIIDGPTHVNNYPIQRGYTRLGWQIGDARYSFHKWL